MSRFVLGIDQSTSGTKAVLFGQDGMLVERYDLPHEQKISPEGWVSHDPMEIYRNTVLAVSGVLRQAGIAASAVAAVGISSQRETALVWDRDTGLPVNDAVVWQCARGAGICHRLEAYGETIRTHTGLPLSPYFSAAKIAWVLEHTPGLSGKRLCAGTIDSWLVFKLTGGRVFCTDYSNASRTQLFNLRTLQWDTEICAWFGIDPEMLPKVCDSNACFGETDFDGLFEKPVPIHGVFGDSHGALYGQGCHETGMVKTTYGTGSSVMMHIGSEPVFSAHGLVTSLAWGLDGRVAYVLEGNINYTGAAIKWLVEEIGLLSASRDAALLAEQANPEDTTYLVPAFTGLGAPYWESRAQAAFVGMTRFTGRAELVKAAEECIAYQITDVMEAMKADTGLAVSELRVDGGPTRDRYLMQVQSDLLQIPVRVPRAEELSAIGAAYAAGIASGVFPKTVFGAISYGSYTASMPGNIREKRYAGWKKAVESVLYRAGL